MNAITAEQLARWLAVTESTEDARQWLGSLGIEDPRRAFQNLVNLAEAGIPLDLLATLCRRLSQELPALSDPDRAINNLDRFVQISRSPLALIALFDRDPRALSELLQIFSVSQHLSDLLIADPTTLDRLRLSAGVPVPREVLIDELQNEVSCHSNERSMQRLLSAFQHREMARIAYGDLIGRQPLQTVTRQLSYLADAICEAAWQLAQQQLAERFGFPSGGKAQFSVIGMGKLGGLELNYSSDIDLVFVYEGEGVTDGPHAIENREYFQRLGRAMMRILTESSEYGALYRVDLRLRPDGVQGPIVISETAARGYYETKGRNWERQAWIKARPVAGHLELGARICEWMEPWVYRPFLGHGDIVDIKLLKRQMEQKAIRVGAVSQDIKIGWGGLRDIEFVVQFLQLLNGGEFPSIRTGNTLDALAQLEGVGCLTRQERDILEDGYVFLRHLEHFLQIMFNRQTHALPADERELSKLARRMGFESSGKTSARQRFDAALSEKRRRHRQILDHILHAAFSEEEPMSPEVDLVLLPDAAPEWVDSLLRKYGFAQTDRAYQLLQTLGSEEIRFLSDARCRRLLATIAQPLLAEIASTPDPDYTLIQLSQVSSSVGGKAVLWELFHVNEASLKLYVRLCAAAPYLAGILTSHPGMIDELMDSLVRSQLPDRREIEQSLDELCMGATDIEPILHGFKNSMHLRVGVRDILGKDDIEATTAALSDIAEACLHQTLYDEFHKLARKYGTPRLEEAATADGVGDVAAAAGLELVEDECDLVVLGMGKLGGREPNYHSDLDVVFLYEEDGQTSHRGRTRRDVTTSNHHFFSELAQRVIRSITRPGAYGRLYEMDPRLRPAGRSGTMAVSVAEFRRYFQEGRGQLWERQALCKARPVFGCPRARRRVMQAVREVLATPPWEPDHAAAILAMRRRMEEGASPRNLKRGIGGTVDIEFLVQMLQLRHASDERVLATGTLQAIHALGEAGYLAPPMVEDLDRNYRFLRNVEARIRLMNSAGRHELPEDPVELARLAYLLRFDDPADLERACETARRRNRQLLTEECRAAAARVRAT